MSRLAAFVVLGLLCLSSAASAQTLPPLVKKCIETVEQARTLSVEITQTYHFVPVKKPDVVTVGSFSLERPNKFAVVCGDDAAASDGTVLSEWNRQNYTSQPAPHTLEAMLTLIMRRGLLLRSFRDPAASLTFLLFTHPDAFAALPNVRDAGPDSVNGRAARRFVTLETPTEKTTLWLAADTGLPLQAVVARGTETYTLGFAQYRISRLILSAAFAAVPPAGLTRSNMPHEQWHFLEPGTPAPDFTLKTPQGQTQTLSALRGRAVLIVFCPLWSLTIPALRTIQQVQASGKVKDFAVLWIVDSHKPEQVTEFAQAHPGMTVLVDPLDSSGALEEKLYRIEATPTFIVVSRAGQVVRGFLGALTKGQTRQQVIKADTRTAAVSLLLHGTVQQDALTEDDSIEYIADQAALEAALTAGSLTKSEK